MASQLALFKKCQLVKTPDKRKHWEFEISFGRHCGKFMPGISKPFFNVLQSYFELTDSQAVEYRDYYQGDVRTRRQLKYHHSDDQITSTETNVVEKRRIAHIDFATMQRKNIGVRFSLRNEIPILEGQPSYPTAYPPTFKHKKTWSIDLKSNPLFRIDLSIVTENTNSTYQVEAEIKNIEMAMVMDVQSLAHACNDVVDELLRVIFDSQPDPISILVIPVSQITPNKTSDIHTRKRKRLSTSMTHHHNSLLLSSPGTLVSPSTSATTTSTTTTITPPVPTPSAIGAVSTNNNTTTSSTTVTGEQFLQSSHHSVDLYTPTGIPNTPIESTPSVIKLTQVPLSTLLASPSPLLVDAKNNTETVVDPALQMLTEDLCQVKVYDWLLVSHSPGTFVIDDENYDWT